MTSFRPFRFLKILVVDAQPIDVLLLEDMLDAADHHAHKGLTDRALAPELFASYQPALLVLGLAPEPEDTKLFASAKTPSPEPVSLEVLLQKKLSLVAPPRAAANYEVVREAAARREASKNEAARDEAARAEASRGDTTCGDTACGEEAYDGMALLAHLKGATSDTDYRPILALLERDDAELKRRALRAGATDLMVKPLDHTDIMLRIGNLLHTRSLHLRARAQNEETQNASASNADGQSADKRDIDKRDIDQGNVGVSDTRIQNAEVPFAAAALQERKWQRKIL